MLNCSNISLQSQKCKDVLPCVSPLVAAATVLMGFAIIISGLIYFGCFASGLFPVVTALLIVGFITCVCGVCLLIKIKIDLARVSVDPVVGLLYHSSELLDSLKNWLGDWEQKYSLNKFDLKSLYERIAIFDRELSRLEHEHMSLSGESSRLKESIIVQEDLVRKFIRSTQTALNHMVRIFEDFGAPHHLEALINLEIERACSGTSNKNQMSSVFFSKMVCKPIDSLLTDIDFVINREVASIIEMPSILPDSSSFIIPRIFSDHYSSEEGFIFEDPTTSEISDLDAKLNLERKLAVLKERSHFLNLIYNAWCFDGQEKALDILVDQEIESVDIVADLEEYNTFIGWMRSLVQLKSHWEGLKIFQNFRNPGVFGELEKLVPSSSDKLQEIQDISCNFTNHESTVLWRTYLSSESIHLFQQVTVTLEQLGYNVGRMRGNECYEVALAIAESKRSALDAAQQNKVFFRKIGSLIDVVDDGETAVQVQQQLKAFIEGIAIQEEAIQAQIEEYKNVRHQRLLVKKEFSDSKSLLERYLQLYSRVSLLLEKDRIFRARGSTSEDARATKEGLLRSWQFMMRLGTPYSILANSMMGKDYFQSEEHLQHKIYFAHVSCMLKLFKLKEKIQVYQRSFLSLNNDYLLISTDFRILLHAIDSLKLNYSEIQCPKAAPFNNAIFIKNHMLLDRLLVMSELYTQLSLNEMTGSEALFLGDRYLSILENLEIPLFERNKPA